MPSVATLRQVAALARIRWPESSDYAVPKTELLSHSLPNDIWCRWYSAGNCNIIKDKFRGKSRGFGFVEMPNKAETEKAIAGLNDFY